VLEFCIKIYDDTKEKPEAVNKKITDSTRK
jgi:hypothetical protein